jgi:hypothetical protein
MQKLSKDQKIIRILLVTIVLNIIFFCVAYPETFKPESTTYARDFSAYYIGEWRLLHNPTQVYYGGALPSDYQILPNPQSFKYSPSFLILLAPFSTLNYQNALNAFDILQIALIPALAFFVYKLVKDKSLCLGAITAVLVMIDPLPSLMTNSAGVTLNLGSFVPSYLLGYALVNAHILQTVLLVGALYFGYTKKPWLSALMLAFGILDPRAALLAFPLLLWYNRQKLLQFIVGSAAFIAITNLPFFFYYGIGFSFLKAEVNGNIISQMYPYDWIPLYAVATLTIVEIITAIQHKRKATTLPQQLPETK